MISNIIDGDGNIKTGTKAWNVLGKVKMYNGNYTNIMMYCLTNGT